MNFKLGIIDSFKPSRGGAKRIANVHYVINGKTVHVQRPINRLNPVECNNNETEIGKQLPLFHMEYFYSIYKYYLFIVVMDISGLFSQGGCYNS